MNASETWATIKRIRGEIDEQQRELTFAIEAGDYEWARRAAIAQQGLNRELLLALPTSTDPAPDHEV